MRWRILTSAQRMKRRYHKMRKVATTYKTGDLVLWPSGATKMADIAATKMADNAVCNKLANKFDGPYRVC